jgi:hypothetical protein
MARPKDPDVDRTWKQRIQRQTVSGLSAAAFCRREGISVRSFYAWNDRLKKRPAPAGLQTPLFVAVQHDSSRHQAGPVLGAGVEMELPHEVRLRFDAPPDPDWLRHVVDAMARIPQKEATT